MNPDFLKFLPIIAAIIALPVGMLLERFRNRQSKIKYKISYQPLATATRDDHWGEIKVFHNNRETNHLNFVTVNIENASNVDHQDMRFSLGCDGESQILAHNAYYDENNATIAIDGDFYNFMNMAITNFNANEDLKAKNINHTTPNYINENLDLVRTNRKFYIPVLNRKEKATFSILVENTEGNDPTVQPILIHKSVKLIKEAEADAEFLSIIKWSMINGLIVYIALLIFIYKLFPLNIESIIYCGIAGLTYSLIGLLFYYIFNLLRSKVF